MVNTTLTLSLLVVTLALPQAFFRWYLHLAADDAERAGILSVTTSLRLAASAIGTVVVALLMPLVVVVMYGSTELLPIFALIAPIVLFDSLLGLPLAVLRAGRRVRAYALLSLSRAVLGSGAIVILVAFVGLGVMGVVVGSALAAAVTATIGLIVLAREGQLRLAWNAERARAMLAFSIPLVPATLATWTLNLSDRYILQLVTGDSAVVGVYALGYTIGLVVSALAVQPFSLAWGASFWELARRDDAHDTFRRTMTLFTAAATLIALALSALATDVLRVLILEARPGFEPSRLIVPFSAFGFVLYGIFTIASSGLNLTGRTRWLPVTMGAAALLTVALNLALIPLIGFMGAAVSTLLGYATLAVLSGVVSHRYYPIAWDLPRVAGALAIGGALAAAALLGPDTPLWRVASVLAYLPLVLLLRIVMPDEVRRLMRALPRRAG